MLAQEIREKTKRIRVEKRNNRVKTKFYRDKTKSNRVKTKFYRVETKSNRVKTKSNRAETKSNRAELKSNRAELKSNRAGNSPPLAIIFWEYVIRFRDDGITPREHGFKRRNGPLPLSGRMPP